jgi:site-specific DNA-methyltransferase (adenine-specific)
VNKTQLHGMMSSKHDDWETPQELFDELDREFGFTLDPCSTHDNAKCENHFTVEEDGLNQSWDGETVFMNPPYGREISKWIQKAHQESVHATVVCLIPARTDTQYWHDHIFGQADDLRFLKGRICFERDGKRGPSPFPSAIVVYRNKKDTP